MTFDITSPLPTSEEYETPCAGRWVLFDSTAPADQTAAAALCRGCQARRTCADIRDELAADITARNNLVGTWAGITFGGQKVAPRRHFRGA